MLIHFSHSSKQHSKTNSYPFSFNIPADSPEYQRCLYGRSTLFLQSNLVTSGTFKNTITSQLVSIFLLANPANRGELPDPFNELLTGWTEDVGVSSF